MRLKGVCCYRIWRQLGRLALAGDRPGGEDHDRDQDGWHEQDGVDHQGKPQRIPVANTDGGEQIEDSKLKSAHRCGQRRD